jgi:hypothetical protein
MTFVDKLFLEYPLPKAISIWGDPNLADINNLVELALDDLSHNLQIIETITVNTMRYTMPEGTKAILNVILELYSQGNGYVKWNYDKQLRLLYLRYFPSRVTYSRSVKLEEIDKIKGVRGQYVKAYILEKMAAKEISYLTSIKLNTEEGDIDLTALEDFRKKQEALYTDIGEDVLVYAG